jgi:hypothetical protein
MHVSTLVRRSAALLVALVAASACSDAPSAPSAAPRASEHPPYDVSALQPLESRGGVSAGLGSRGGGDVSSDSENTLAITIDPNVSRTYAFGQNWIYFPARSICDPATSGYGLGLWDTPCTALDKPITVTVHWSSKGGHAYARFEPALRFVPADARSVLRWVILSLHDQRRLHDLDDYTILYYADDSRGWVNEELTDPTLHAWLNWFDNSVSRRIKHFSGYMLASGFTRGDLGGIGDASY